VAESIANSKGQTTLFASLRASLNVQPGTGLLWHVMLDGTVIVRVKSKSNRGLAGSVKTDKHVCIRQVPAARDAPIMARMRRCVSNWHEHATLNISRGITDFTGISQLGQSAKAISGIPLPREPFYCVCH